MILDAVADQPISALTLACRRLVDERDVRRRDVVLRGDRFDRRQQLLRAAAEQARSRHGRERHRNLELGIILPACPLPRPGPAVVEHILALTVALEIGSRGGDQVVGIVLNQDRRRRPARARPDAARILKRRQKRVADEWVARSEPIPSSAVQARHARCDLGDDVSFAVGHRLPR